MTQASVISMPTKPRSARSAALHLGRWGLLVCMAILPCSCRSLSSPTLFRTSAASHESAVRSAAPPVSNQTVGAESSGSNVQLAAYHHPPSLPPDAWTAAPVVGGAAACCPPEMAGCGMPGDMHAATWRPPGIAGVWPADEYLFDGGDHPPSAEVMPDWSVLGLDLEDTIAHYDTLDGRTEVQASNRVPIYAPRFASVRQVAGLSMSHSRDGVAGVELPRAAITQEDQQLATTVHQPVQSERYLGLRSLQGFRERAGTLGVTGDMLLARISDRFKIHEDFQVIRDGTFDNSEKARLAVWLAAAHAWQSDQAAQVILDEHAAVQVTGRTRVQSVYEYELPEGKPRLRIIKVASTAEAQPGDEIEFTLRFDNVGDQVIGNVTIIDNLTTRLEYLPNTAECSVDARFLTQENDGESLVLRWEILDPLAVGQGGIIRFRCRVR
jgi:uncharacterized repeat protein (TIGR01451 family)